MMNVLDLLQSRLSRNNQTLGMGGGSSVPPMSDEAERRLRAMGPVPPSYLPEQVWNSILNQPSYGEGEIMAPEQWWIPSLGGQMQREGPQRDERLFLDRQEATGRSPLPPGLKDQPEGGVWSSRPSWQSPFASPFASPLNQLMQLGRRTPLSMY